MLCNEPLADLAQRSLDGMNGHSVSFASFGLFARGACIMPPSSTASTKQIRKVAVLGAGTMGSRIAAHIANAGLPVVLLDIVPAGHPGRRREGDKEQACPGRSGRPEEVQASRLLQCGERTADYAR